jgi:hypothetical protein
MTVPDTSVAIPKFATYRWKAGSEFRNHKPRQKILILVCFFEFEARADRDPNNLANFKFSTLTQPGRDDQRMDLMPGYSRQALARLQRPVVGYRALDGYHAAEHLMLSVAKGPYGRGSTSYTPCVR